MDARKLLDALVGASSVPDDSKVARPDPIQDMLAMFGGAKGDLGGLLGRTFRDALGGLRDLGEDTNVLRKPGAKGGPEGKQSGDLDALLEKARGMFGGKLPSGALIGLAGLLLGTRGGRGVALQLAKLGGLIQGTVLRDVLNKGYRPQSGPWDSDFGGRDAHFPPSSDSDRRDGFTTGGSF